MSAHVIYESRLELARLLMADFDASVNHIVAQPFMKQTPIGGKMRRHVPDYLLRADGSPVVVDVKPAELLDHPAVAETFDWVRAAVDSLGWSFEVASEQPRVMMETSAFFGVIGAAAMARQVGSQRHRVSRSVNVPPSVVTEYSCHCC